MTDIVLENLSCSLFGGSNGELYTLIDGEKAGAKAFFGSDTVFSDESLASFFTQFKESKPKQGEKVLTEKGQVFCEVVRPLPRLCLCGGGHVSLPLAQIGAMLGFFVTVIDDREEFANKERFSMAEHTYNGDFGECIAKFDGGENDYFVIVTRGHSEDRYCLENVLTGRYAYCGMIGSRTKNQIIFDYLIQHGFSQKEINTVYAPIGLMIGAQTPAEIAVAIAAQLVEVKASYGSASAWDRAMLAAVANLDKAAALAVIIQSSGSTPRGPGARMLVFADGSIIGSVGGGMAEAEAIRLAQKVIVSDENGIYHCAMNNKNAAEMGLICGGEMDVFIEKIN